MSVVDLFPEHINEDLARSGLTPSDVRARALGPNEKHATGTPNQVEGYVLPYFDMRGKPLPFYRARLYDYEPKYRQLVNQPNHLYFPPGFWALVHDEDTKCIIFTEGEKKAACAVKHGYAAVAAGGVDSWRNRIIHMPRDTNLAQAHKGVVARLPSGAEGFEKTDSMAHGFKELIELALHKNLPIVICYDSDTKHGPRPEVQTAAATLGFELRFRGLPQANIRQLILRPTTQSLYTGEKLALDDYLLHESLGPSNFRAALEEVLDAPSAFPRHPNPRAYINKRLQRARLPRQDIQALATAILCDLDSRGARYRNPDDHSLYYFKESSHELIPVDLDPNREWYRTPFGIHLYKEYNLGVSDDRVIKWLGSQFTGEDPISTVKPERVMTIRKDTLYYQLTKGRSARVNKDGITIVNNGDDGVLFQSTDMNELDLKKLQEHIAELYNKPLPNYWYQSLKDSRVRNTNEEGILDKEDKQRKLLSLLYHISPWMYRWRGTQLPLEMMIAEPGSGKSTMYELRLNTITGSPILRNAPNDLKDWTASIAQTGGLHVTDNVNKSNTTLRQQLSDELCRIITEPDPHIEFRQLYSDNTLCRTAVRTVFAITAVKQPFVNPDIIQRSIITELDKGSEEIFYEGGWAGHQLEKFGGREGWAAHQLVFQHRLFKAIADKWDPKYKSRFRLINVDQLLTLSAEVLGWDGSWIGEYLEGERDKTVSETDWALSGLKAFAEEMAARIGYDHPTYTFDAQDIVEWALTDPEYERCQLLTSARVISRHIKANSNMVAMITGIQVKGQIGNKITYALTHPRGKAT